MKTRNNNGISVRLLVMILALTLIVGGIVGGSVAWLTAQTDPVTNTFTVGDINITLAESNNLDLKMVPGKTITKDPKVTVLKDSEACWLFVKVEKSANFDDFMTYTMVSEWQQLYVNSVAVPGVYYREVSAADAKTGVEYGIIADNHVSVKDTVTKADMNALTPATYPTLTFTANAVQKDGFATAKEAWDATFGKTEETTAETTTTNP